MLINGVEQTQIDARDRGLQYGDGCFTTMLVENGQFQLWPQHKVRLQQALSRLGIVFEQWLPLENALAVLSLPSRAVIKIQITRGVGGRGYAPAESQQSQWLLSVSDFPNHYSTWQKQGIQLALSNIQLAKQPLLSGIKHLNRLEQVLIKQDARAFDTEDVLVCDTDGMLVETSAANIFWLVDGVWHTPDLYYAGVEGVMRNQVLQLLLATGHHSQQIRAPLSHIQQAEAVFICNSLMQIVPVIKLNDTEFSLEPVKQLQSAMGMKL